MSTQDIHWTYTPQQDTAIGDDIGLDEDDNVIDIL